MTPRCPICFLKRGPLPPPQHFTRTYVGLGVTLICSCHIPPPAQNTLTPPRPLSTHGCSTRMYTHVSQHSKRAINRWEQLQGGRGTGWGGGVWKAIFPPQKPQRRRDKALNPQGPLGGAQRYTQLARSPPWASLSRCPCPSHLCHCPARGAWRTRDGNS